MKMNKLCATAMAVVMTMSVAAVPAFADDTAKSAATNVTATVNGSYRYALEGTKILAVDGSCSNEMKYELLKTVDAL